MQSRRVTRDPPGVRCTFLNIMRMFGRIEYFSTWDGWLAARWCKATLGATRDLRQSRQSRMTSEPEEASPWVASFESCLTVPHKD
jgi:hypothetical protein